MTHIIIVILVFVGLVCYCTIQSNKESVVNNVKISNWNKSIFIRNDDLLEHSIEFVFFASSHCISSIDTFMIVVNDGYIYKGAYSDDIIIDNIHIKPQNFGYENYTTIGFLGFDNETSSIHWWQEKQNYNLAEIKKVYAFIFPNGMCFTIN